MDSRSFSFLPQSICDLSQCAIYMNIIFHAHLRTEGFELAFVTPLRIAFLAGAALWSSVVCWQIAGAHVASRIRQVLAMVLCGAAVAIGVTTWALLFWG